MFHYLAKLLPISHQARYNWADTGTLKIPVNPTQVRHVMPHPVLQPTILISAVEEEEVNVEDGPEAAEEPAGEGQADGRGGQVAAKEEGGDPGQN